MNGSTAHLVVVAEDSGVPPRRASVPVVVRSDLFLLFVSLHCLLLSSSVLVVLLMFLFLG